MKNCLIIAGEKSGEEHALSFLPLIMQEDKDIRFFGVGGDKMRSLGVDLIYHLNDFSTWGISGAIKKIPFYYNALKKVENEVVARDCKVAILIDYQTFNLKLATRLAKRGVKILYYVAPQAWAWKSRRVKTLEKCVDTLFCILPFEKKWFMDRGVSKAVTVEHPLLKHYEEGLAGFDRQIKDFSRQQIQLLLLPGSRNFEVTGLMPNFIKVVQKLKTKFDLRVAIVESSSVNPEAYNSYREYYDEVYRDDELEMALKESDFALASSGTVNLACALYALPTIVAYTGSLLNEYIYYSFVNYKGHISLANIVHQDEVFPEFIVPRDSVFNIYQKCEKIFSDPKIYNNIVEKLKKTKEIISGEEINVSSYMAERIRKSYE
jgi:lipid-A-disaccharide synthase